MLIYPINNKLKECYKLKLVILFNKKKDFNKLMLVDFKPIKSIETRLHKKLQLIL